MPENDLPGLWPKLKATIFKNVWKGFAAAVVTLAIRNLLFDPKGTHKDCPWCEEHLQNITDDHHH